MARDIREERNGNVPPVPPAAPTLPNRPVGYPLLRMRHDTGYPPSWDNPSDRPGYNVSNRFTAGRGKLYFYNVNWTENLSMNR